MPVKRSLIRIKGNDRLDVPDGVSTRHNAARVDRPFPGKTLLKNIPAFTFIYVGFVSPFHGYAIAGGTERIENVIVWLVMFGATVLVALRNWSIADISFLTSPPVLTLAIYLCFAGASIGWALNPQAAMKGFVLQTIIVVMVVLPFAFPIPRSYAIPSLHVCFVPALVVNAAIVLTYPPSPLGHVGYFPHKQMLGIFAASAMFLSLHELFQPGWRRLLALITGPVAFWLTLESNSKTSLALAIAMPILAFILTVLNRYLKIRPSTVLLGITIVGMAVADPVQRISFMLYGDYTVTGRIYIWDFINYQISWRPWLGWGFYSYWFIPEAPAAPGFIKDMVSSHNGYLELKLYTGFLGYWLFLTFVFVSVRSVDKMQDESMLTALVLWSITLFTLVLNLTDSVWLGTNPTWVLYLVVVAMSASSTGRLAVPERSAAKRRQRARPIGLGNTS